MQIYINILKRIAFKDVLTQIYTQVKSLRKFLRYLTTHFQEYYKYRYFYSSETIGFPMYLAMNSSKLRVNFTIAFCVEVVCECCIDFLF